jgi:hypothetical protein
VLEHLYVTLRHGETRQAFNIWVYGDRELSRGSGLFIGENGISENHHFLLPKDGTGFEFRPGDYRLEIHARRVGDSQSSILAEAEFSVPETAAEHIRQGRGGVFFDWGPESARYHQHLDFRPDKRTVDSADANER